MTQIDHKCKMAVCQCGHQPDGFTIGYSSKPYYMTCRCGKRLLDGHGATDSFATAWELVSEFDTGDEFYFDDVMESVITSGWLVDIGFDWMDGDEDDPPFAIIPVTDQIKLMLIPYEVGLDWMVYLVTQRSRLLVAADHVSDVRGRDSIRVLLAFLGVDVEECD